MVEQTPNHKLNLYERGDTDWSHSPDMETIEERLVIRDREENLTEYTPYPVATFIATDTGAVYDGDGERWSLAKRAIRALDTGEFNGRPHVVASGGSEKWNDLIDDLPESARGETIARIGEHELETDERSNTEYPGAILVRDSTNVRGRGFGSHLKALEATNLVYADYDNRSDEPEADQHNFILSDLRLDGNKDEIEPPETGGHRHNGVLTYGFQSGFSILNCWAHDFFGYGFHLDAAEEATVLNCRVDRTDGQGMHIATRTVGDTVYGPRKSAVGFSVVTDPGSNGIDFGGEKSFASKMIGNTVVGAPNSGIFSGGIGHVLGLNTVLESEKGVALGARRAGWEADENQFEPSFGQISIGNTVDDAEYGVDIKDNVGSIADANTVRESRRGIRVEDSEDIQIGPTVIDAAETRGLWVRGSKGVGVTGLTVRNSPGAAPIRIEGSESVSLTNCRVVRSGGAIIEPDATDVKLSNVTVEESEGWHAIRVMADGTIISGATLNANTNFGITVEAEECILRDVRGEDNGGNLVNDNGIRTLINGRGVNNGDPSVEGTWNGHADYAEEQNALIHDERNDGLYRAVNGMWIKVGDTTAERAV